MHVPEDVEQRILSSSNPVNESVEILCEVFNYILINTHGTGVPIGINVESLSIFKEEINAAHNLFQRLQVIVIIIIFHRYY